MWGRWVEVSEAGRWTKKRFIRGGERAKRMGRNCTWGNGGKKERGFSIQGVSEKR